MLNRRYGYSLLLKFAWDKMLDEKLKCHKLESRLIPEIAEMVVVYAYTNYQSLFMRLFR